MKPDEKTKEIILSRLYDSVGICGHCGKRECQDKSYRVLPGHIEVDKILRAINFNEEYFKELN